MITGRYQQRFGHEFNPGPPGRSAEGDIGLPTTETTMANALKAAGYKTGVVGKWHLGMAPEFHPLRRGFDEFYGFLHGSHSYLDAKADPHNPILRGTEPVEEQAYLTDAITREAVAFIERHHGSPFFLYLTYNAVHAPMQATGKYLDRFKNITEAQRRTYAAMLSAMDDGIGEVLKKLREHNLERDTMIFFFSDNGGPPTANGSRNDPLRGQKGTVYEGGIRVPFLLQWKGRVPGGKVYDHPVISLDVFPTAAAAGGAALPKDRPIDGVNLLPFLTGRNEAPPHDTLFWRYGENRALRRGQWKLIQIGGGPVQLYDLSSDVSESKDLSAENSALVNELLRSFQNWESQLAKPLWGGRGAQATRPRRPATTRTRRRRARQTAPAR